MAYNAERRRSLALGLKAARRRANVSASHASQMIAANGVKCSRGTLLAWERGVGRTSREPFASDLAVIARVYCCKVDEFFMEAAPDAGADLKINLHAPHGAPSVPGAKLQSSPASGMLKAMADGSPSSNERPRITPGSPPSAN